MKILENLFYTLAFVTNWELYSNSWQRKINIFIIIKMPNLEINVKTFQSVDH